MQDCRATSESLELQNARAKERNNGYIMAREGRGIQVPGPRCRRGSGEESRDAKLDTLRTEPTREIMSPDPISAHRRATPVECHSSPPARKLLSLPSPSLRLYSLSHRQKLPMTAPARPTSTNARITNSNNGYPSNRRPDMNSSPHDALRKKIRRPEILSRLTRSLGCGIELGKACESGPGQTRPFRPAGCCPAQAILLFCTR